MTTATLLTGMHTVDIRPEVNILGMLKNLNYKPWYALAEFVDNSVGSFERNREGNGLDTGQDHVKVRIHPKPADNVIEIVDDAAGIALSDFARAFRAAEVPPDRSGLSEFGMGMKSAATWFGDRWKVTTTVRGEPILRTVEFDIDRITSQKVEQLDVVESAADVEDHYTVVTLIDIHHFPVRRTVGKIKDHLRSIYRAYLRSGELRLYYDDEELKVKEVDPLVAAPVWEPSAGQRTWKRHVEFDFGNGQSASGFVGVRSKGSNAEAGFALMRRGRLILGSHDEPYKPIEIVGQSNDFRAQRLYGEIELHGFEVSHTKDGIKWGPTTEEMFIERLAEALSHPEHDFSRQARLYRSGVSGRSEQRVIESSTQRVADQVPAAIAAASDFIAHESPSLQTGAELPRWAGPVTSATVPFEVVEAESSTSTKEAVIADRRWFVTVTSSWSQNDGPWLHFKRDEQDAVGGQRDHLGVVLNLSHPFARQFRGTSEDSTAALITFACAVAVASTLQRDAGGRVDFGHLLDVALRALASVDGGSHAA